MNAPAMTDTLHPSGRRDKPHARIYAEHLLHPAWQALSPNAFRLIVELLARYRPDKPNSFGVGGKSVHNLIGVSEKTATRIVDELIEAGHLFVERKGSNRGSVTTRERVVSLTRWHTLTRAGDPCLWKKVWEEKQTRQKGPVEHGKNDGSEKSGKVEIANGGGANVVLLETYRTRV